MSIFNKFPKTVTDKVKPIDFCTDDEDFNLEEYYFALEDEYEQQLMDSEWDSFDRRSR